MGKNKGFDVIAEAHERANHNINPYYWFNRVTLFTVAQWKTNKYFTPMFFVIITSIGVLSLNSFNQTAIIENKTFWSFIFDFSDSSTSTRFVGILLFLIYWVITGIGSFQSIMQRILAPSPKPLPEQKKEKKKKLPKRPKNYK
jgi:hypothetical protein